MIGCACVHVCCCDARTVACPYCCGSGRIVVRNAFPIRTREYPVPRRAAPAYCLAPLRF